MSVKRNFILKLDLFTGFYESFYYNSDQPYYAITNEVDYYNDEVFGGKEIMEYDDFDFDFDRYCKDVIECLVPTYNRYAPGIVEDIKYHHIWSPQYYNFATDEIYCNFKLVKNWRSEMRAWMNENKDWLRNRIKEDWTSYDGFISFMENNIDLWYDKIFKEMDSRYIGCIITYMMLRQDSDVRNQIAVDTLDDIYDFEYVIFSCDEAREKCKKYQNELCVAR